ncbi:MAG: NADH-quinone oxidoreductase subunit H [Candidatus Binatus sp.]|uniref:respiratory chain complex I subunit 1 family protein n=1 Tax=Candidatus Binatus sp. TaxID=2811406 RepID=UPI002721EAE9|nr:NADH-quinone oxidoreductase subunit H [Candidatus Binatus sp.]MDO8432313.1 NADH-quinone oxidoreductase subunit H [Candidatus Binatus sp.]
MLGLALELALAPLLLGVITRTKSWVSGRSGPPLLQLYFDLQKLLRKGAVYSRTTTWIFRAGPIISLASVLTASLVLPLGASSSPMSFSGDVIVFAYLLALGRFFTMAAALDTGSSFEGMGASREAAFSALTEPALFLGLAILCVSARSVTFADVWRSLPWSTWGAAHPAYLAVAAALFAVLLAENARIPVDDPATHLELTMIHEVMVLDHSGPDLALILYAGAVKFFVIGALLVHVLLPVPAQGGLPGALVMVTGELALAILVGITESVMARLRLIRVPQFLIGATAIAALGLAVLLYRGQP